MTGASGATGGIAAANLNVLRALVSMSRATGSRLTVLSLHEGPGDRPGCLGTEDTFRGFRGSKIGYAAALVARFRPGRVFVFDHVRLALPLTPAIALGFRGYVVMAHGSESWRRVRWMSKWLFRRAGLCLTNSRFTLERMRKTFSGFRGRACALGLPPTHPRTDSKRLEAAGEMSLRAVDGCIRALGHRVILLVGRMDAGEREKGHRELLTIWPRILERWPEAQLVFAGPGNDRPALMAMARRLQVAPGVFIPGFLPVETLRDLYTRCYAFVMPSRQEGFGLAYLEAMNHGKPCIACRDGGGEEVVEDGVSGLLLDNPYANDVLLDAVGRLLASEELARRLGQGGLRRLEENFTSGHAQARLQAELAGMMPCA